MVIGDKKTICGNVSKHRFLHCVPDRIYSGKVVLVLDVLGQRRLNMTSSKFKISVQFNVNLTVV